MRLLFLNRSYGPDSEATGQLLAELCSDLAIRHRVTVIAGPGQRRSPRPIQVEEHDGVRVVRTWGTRFAKARLAGRLANLASYYGLAALAALREEPPDVVVAETDPPLLGLLGAWLQHRRRCRFVYYCQDLYPEVARATGGLRNPLLLELLRRATDIAYRRADAIVVLGRDMVDALAARGVRGERVGVIPNWADCKAVRPLDDSAFRRELGEGFVVMYSGNLGLSQGLITVLDAAERMSDEGVRFVLIGAGAGRDRIAAQITRRRLTNVRLLPYQPRARLSQSLSTADLHLVPLQAGVAGCLVPSKVYGILAAGRPFVAMMEEHAEAARLAREFDVGFVLPPQDAGGLVATIRAARADPDRLAAMRSRARAVAETHFDRPIAVEQFERLLGSMKSIAKPAPVAQN